MKQITFDERGTLDFEFGKDDPYKAFIVIDDNCIGEFGSTFPNPYQVSTGKKAIDVYGQISAGKYDIQCIQHDKFGKCFLIQNGGVVPCDWDNINHGGERILTEVFIHRGFNNFWRGSYACLTVHPSFFDIFMKKFEVGEKCELIIKRS